MVKVRDDTFVHRFPEDWTWSNLLSSTVMLYVHTSAHNSGVHDLDVNF